MVLLYRVSGLWSGGLYVIEKDAWQTCQSINLWVILSQHCYAMKKNLDLLYNV